VVAARELVCLAALPFDLIRLRARRGGGGHLSMTAPAPSPAQSPIRSDWHEPLAAAEEVEVPPLELDSDHAISDREPLNFVERARNSNTPSAV